MTSAISSSRDTRRVVRATLLRLRVISIVGHDWRLLDMVNWSVCVGKLLGLSTESVKAPMDSTARGRCCETSRVYFSSARFGFLYCAPSTSLCISLLTSDIVRNTYSKRSAICTRVLRESYLCPHWWDAWERVIDLNVNVINWFGLIARQSLLAKGKRSSER